jgi:hypothetical protein
LGEELEPSEKWFRNDLENLRDEIAALQRRVTSLEERLIGHPESASMVRRNQEAAESSEVSDSSGSRSENIMANIMSRGATVSLILLLALVLRVMTDNGILDLKIGTLAGIGYAALLEGAGLFMYKRRSPFAAIFSVSGILLLLTVVLEAHKVFGSLNTAPAYTIMAVAAGGMTVMSHLYKTPLPACVGISCVLLAGTAMDFPEPDFALLSVYLAAINVMAFSFSYVQKPSCRWLRIVVFVLTAGIVLLWAVNLSAALKMEVSLPADTMRFFISNGFFLLFYTVMSVLSVWMGKPGDEGTFISILPTAACTVFYATSLMVFNSVGTGQHVLGMVGVGIATGLLGIAALRAQGPVIPPKGINTFAFPAAFLLAFSFRDVSGKSVAALAILSWAALKVYFHDLFKMKGIPVVWGLLLFGIAAATGSMVLKNWPGLTGSPDDRPGMGGMEGNLQ